MGLWFGIVVAMLLAIWPSVSLADEPAAAARTLLQNAQSLTLSPQRAQGIEMEGRAAEQLAQALGPTNPEALTALFGWLDDLQDPPPRDRERRALQSAFDALSGPIAAREQAELVSRLAARVADTGRCEAAADIVGRLAEPAAFAQIADVEKFETDLSGVLICFVNAGGYVQRAQLMERLAHAAEAALSPNNRNVNFFVGTTASAYALAGRTDKAEQFYRQGVAVAERIFGPAHQGTVSASVALAEFYRANGRVTDSADALEQRSEAVWTARGDATGPDSVLTRFADMTSLMFNTNWADVIDRVADMRRKKYGAADLRVIAAVEVMIARASELHNPLIERLALQQLQGARPDDTSTAQRVAARLRQLPPPAAQTVPIASSVSAPSAPVAQAEKAVADARATHPKDSYALLFALYNLGTTLDDPNDALQIQRTPEKAIAAYEAAIEVAARAVKAGNVLGPSVASFEHDARVMIAKIDMDRTDLPLPPVTLDPSSASQAEQAKDDALRQQTYAAGEAQMRAALALEPALGREGHAVSADDVLGDRVVLLKLLWYQRKNDELRALVVEIDNLVNRPGQNFLFQLGVQNARDTLKMVGDTLVRESVAQANRPTAAAPEAAALFETIQRKGPSTAARAYQFTAALAAADRAGPDVASVARRLVDNFDRQDRLRAGSQRDAEQALSGGPNQVSPGFGTGDEYGTARQLAYDVEQDFKKLEELAPSEAELLRPSVVPLAKAQSLLDEHEALLVFSVGPTETIVMAVRHARVAINSVAMLENGMRKEVVDLLNVLDPDNIGEIDNAAVLPAFPAQTAYDLYAELLGPLQTSFKDADHILLVLDGPLQALPLNVLLTEKPQVAAVRYDGMKGLHWLGLEKAMSVWPSVSSLVTYRSLGKVGEAPEPFLGIGDPDLANQPASKDDSPLDPLPGTADELKSIAQILGAPASDVRLSAEATLAWVMSAPLDRFRTLAFATHTVFPGQFGQIEPALVMSPVGPDWLLRASQIAGLRLNADWVILSACDTAIGDVDDRGEALSGLARAFFIAGARSLLVSHWPVLSDAARKLTTGTVQAWTAEGVGRAEALRRSMQRLVDLSDHGQTQFAHPLYWAPFTIIGEGATGR